LTRYVERGFKLVFYATKTKGPREKGWNSKECKPEDYQEGQNVGVLLGTEIAPGRFLVDVDFDWPQGIPLAKRLLPGTMFGFGRDTRQLTHVFFTTSQPIPNDTFDDVDGKPFVEFRSVAKDGSLGQQTMVPPSIHPNGEQLVLRWDGDIGHADDLHRRLTLYSIGCILLQHLGERGLLHDVRLATAGFLLKTGLTVEETISVCEAIAEVTGNDVSDVATAVRSTASRIKGDGRVLGKGALEKQIGDKGKAVTKLIRSWLGIKEFLTSEKGVILANKEENIVRALEQLKVDISFDTFAQKSKVIYNGFNGPLEDFVRNRILLDIDKHFYFKPTGETFDMVLLDRAHHNRRHPVHEYLDDLKWDGVPRVDEFFIKHGGAADTEYVRAVTAIMLIAAVRRVRKPGCKLDEMIVLEGPQGTGKSSALRTLCPNDDWFSDDFPLDADSKEIIECTAGKWIIEAGELSGIRKAQTEHMKLLMSKQWDGPVRMAYARLPIEVPRQFITVGTTNSRTYLKDETGSRRFWPMLVKEFDLAGIAKVRDQVWAEANQREKAGESIRLVKDLYSMAAFQQERRRIEDPWEVEIESLFPVDKKARAWPELIWETLHIQKEKRDERSWERILKIMTRLGFERATVRNDDGKVVKGWKREIQFSLLDEEGKTQ
jgi:predicted P-loop ATPase